MCTCRWGIQATLAVSTAALPTEKSSHHDSAMAMSVLIIKLRVTCSRVPSSSMRGGIKKQPDQGPVADTSVHVQTVQSEGGQMLLNPRSELLELLLTS